MQTETPLLPHEKQEQEDQATRQYSKIDSAPLARYLKATGHSSAAFAEKIGVTAGCVCNWIRNSMMPQYIGLLVDHLQAEHDATLTTSINVYGTHENIDAVMPLLARFDLTVNQR